jgi:hypothetical protein
MRETSRDRNCASTEKWPMRLSCCTRSDSWTLPGGGVALGAALQQVDAALAA